MGQCWAFTHKAHSLHSLPIAHSSCVCSSLGGDVTAGDQWVTLGYDGLSATSTVLSWMWLSVCEMGWLACGLGVSRIEHSDLIIVISSICVTYVKTFRSECGCLATGELWYCYIFCSVKIMNRMINSENINSLLHRIKSFDIWTKQKMCECFNSSSTNSSFTLIRVFVIRCSLEVVKTPLPLALFSPICTSQHFHRQHLERIKRRLSWAMM